MRVYSIKSHHAQLHCKVLGLCLGLLLPFIAVAQAPVVDDSDNFAIIEDQQVAFQSPAANKKYAQDADYDHTSSYNEDTPLIKDDGSSEAAIDMPGEANLADKVQNLQKELQELRGQLEVQSHELKILKDQQLSFYKDLDSRLKNPQQAVNSNLTKPAINDAKAPVGLAPKPMYQKKAVSLPTSKASNNPADEQIRYLAAYELVKNKNFDKALVAMQNFIEQYPHGGYTGNAHYWLGELYLTKNNYPKAIEEFSVVVQNYPNSSKVSASSLKIGYALAAAGQKEEAMIRLKQVIDKYPNSAAAQLAAVKLDSLEVA